MILKRYRYRLVTVFGSPLLTVTVFWPTLQTVTLPFGTIRYHSGPSVIVTKQATRLLKDFLFDTFHCNFFQNNAVNQL